MWPNFLKLRSRIKIVSLYSNEIEIDRHISSKIHQMVLGLVQNESYQKTDTTLKNQLFNMYNIL